MPELPEVETVKEGIKIYLQGQRINQVVVHNPRLRMPVLANISQLCSGQMIHKVERRAKYLLIHLDTGHLLIHLGMSGHLRIAQPEQPTKKHDHVILQLDNHLTLRYHDPRRFGLFHYLSSNPLTSSLLNHLGPEPLTDEFNGDYLYQQTRGKTQAIKSLIMNNKIVVGVGNIYAAESLFLAKIHPLSPAKTTSMKNCMDLAYYIKTVLKKAIKAGGTTLRDFYSSDGAPGYFSTSLQVYGRKNQPCFACAQPIENIMISGRQSAFCPQCQKA
jgi:formamidopyrimidine-DNA glycosylase